MLCARRYLVQHQDPGGADGPTKSYALGENAMDEINAEELKGFIDKASACSGSAVCMALHLELIVLMPSNTTI